MTPTLTVYVIDPNGEFSVTKWFDHLNSWNHIRYVTPKVLPDPSYINAIINDASSDTDKIQRLQKYLDTFGNLIKY